MSNRVIIMTATSVMCFVTAAFNPEHWIIIGIGFGLLSGFLQTHVFKGDV